MHNVQFHVFFVWIAQCISLVWAILLPSVSASLYFYAKEDVANNLTVQKVAGHEKGGAVNTAFEEDGVVNRNTQIITMAKSEDGSGTVPAPVDAVQTQTAVKPKFSCQTAFRMLWKHFIMAYSNPTVVVWSIWWAVAMSGFLQVKYQFWFIYLRAKLKWIVFMSKQTV